MSNLETEILIKTECPMCQHENWYEMAMCDDIDGVICSYCSKRYLLGEVKEAEDAIDNAISDFVEKYRPFISDEEEFLWESEKKIHPSIVERKQRMFSQIGKFQKSLNN